LAHSLCLLVAALPAAGEEEAPRTHRDGDLFAGLQRPADLPDDAALEAAGALVGAIEIRVNDVFNLADPEENNLVFRLANRLHIRTRAGVVRRELLFREGDPYSGRLLAESERLLRAAEYLYDARVLPVRYADNRVDVLVVTRDVWTLQIGFGFSRSGGENKFRIGIQDSNFLGWGKDVTIQRSEDVDRTSNLYRYRDPNVMGRRVKLRLAYQDNSDGFLRDLSLARPFYSLDSRRAGGLAGFDYDRVDPLYTLGEVRERFRHVEEFVELHAGFSTGLRGSRAERWSLGLTYEDHRFSPADGYDPPTNLPDDRRLVYPWINFTLLEDRFAKLRNLDLIQRTEDLNFGTDFRIRLGWSSESLGADRDQAILSVGVNAGFVPSESQILLAALHASGRWGSGGTENVLVGGSLRYFIPSYAENRFHVLVQADLAGNLDGENQLLLGGDSGLRGYPLRYQEGDRRYLVSLEHRFYTDLYLFRLIRVGAAVFLDAGEAWFAGPAGEEHELGLLKDVGCGLRLGSTRSSRGSMVHVDVAFPLDGDPSIDSVQFLVTTRERF
jgi:hypothetical protein